MNQGYTYRNTVRPAQHGTTVLEFYSTLYTDFSRDEWIHRIEQGYIFLDNKPASSGDVLQSGDVLEYRRPPWEEPPVPTMIDVLYDDPELTVFHKPSGIPVLPGGGYLENTLLHIVRQRHGTTLSPIHRLGRGTTGAIVFTKTPVAASVLSKALRDGDITKTYLALVQGIVKEDSFDVDAPIGLVPHPLLGKVYASNEHGKPSRSHVSVLERRTEKATTLVSVDIPTGRPHQIRIHMAYAGYPLAGDPLYKTGGGVLLQDDPDATAVPGDCGYTLHSWQISFPHPLSGRRQLIEAPPPHILLPED